jgi:hypothetical protein
MEGLQQSIRRAWESRMTPTTKRAVLCSSLEQTNCAFIRQMRIIGCGAQKCAARSLHRLTHQRPARTTNPIVPTQRWCSDCGKVRANVTGNSARTDGLHPSLALGLYCTEVASSRRRRLTQGHPAAAMGNPVRVRSLWDTHRSGSYGKRWEPWTRLEPGVTLPARGVVARCWAVLQ